MNSKQSSNGLKKLIRLAKAEIDHARVDLVEIETAKASNNAALDALLQECAVAEATANTDPALLPAKIQFCEGADLRRAALRKAGLALEKAEGDTRDRLDHAIQEYKKLEILIAADVARSGKATKNQEAAGADDWAARAASKSN